MGACRRHFKIQDVIAERGYKPNKSALPVRNKDDTLCEIYVASGNPGMHINACEFVRIYSHPTHEYIDDGNQFRKHATWLSYCNGHIKGFTKCDNRVVNKPFTIAVLDMDLQYYERSPVWLRLWT